MQTEVNGTASSTNPNHKTSIIIAVCEILSQFIVKSMFQIGYKHSKNSFKVKFLNGNLH